MAEVLIIDDDELIREMLTDMVQRMGHKALSSGTLKEGLKEAQAGAPDIIFLDIRMPDGNGLDLLPELRAIPSKPEVIIITGLGDPDGAELAIKNGAWDYIKKASSLKETALPFLRALQYREEKNQRRPVTALRLDNIIGNSEKIKTTIDSVAQVANSEGSVLIHGETGTGKELFARAVHDNSPRAEKNFVVVDCTTLPETLVESVLFGYEKGAYTGADRARDGLVKQAHGGTLFLDEIGELPLPVQKAFLRVLQEHRYRTVGGKNEIESDFRLICATNQNIDEMVKAGQFRMDLSFRIRTLTIEIPALRERPEDLKDLAIHYMSKICERYKIGAKGFSPEFFDALASYDWPGNVRELINAIEQAIAASKDEPTLFPKHLPTDIRVKIARSSMSKESSSGDGRHRNEGSYLIPINDYRDSMEYQYLRDLMFHTRGNIKEACKISQLSRSRLYALLKQHNLTGTA
jgi:two-component system, NtrC family, response regulator